MPGIISIKQTKSLAAVRFVLPGNSTEVLTFTPLQGQLTITVSGAQQGDVIVVGKPEADPDKPGSGGGPDIVVKQDVALRLTLSGAKKATKDFRFKDAMSGTSRLILNVSSSEAGKECRIRVKNIGRTDVKVGLSATFVGKRHMTNATAIPLRVLNNALQQAIDALGLVIHVNGSRSVIDFSPDLKKLSGGRVKRRRFSVPGVVKDFNLKTLRALAVAKGQKAFVRFLLDFETAGTEIQLGDIPLIDITKAAVQVELELRVFGEPAKRQLLPLATVNVDFEASNLPGDAPLFITDEEKVKDAIRDKLLETLNSTDMSVSVGNYLALGLTQLAQRGHTFHNLTADSDSFLVEHYDPRRNISGGLLLTPDESFQEAGPMGGFDLPSGVSPKPAEIPPDLAKIDHIVVLMQENRSFDHMVGYLRLQGGRDDVDGLTGQEGNSAPELGIGIPVRVNPLGRVDLPYSPHHDHAQVLLQVADGDMSGFIRSYVDRFPGVDPRFGMGFFSADQVRTFDFLARQFLLCDRWFCSHPGPTMPNRFATLSGQIVQLDNFDVDDPAIGFVKLPTIFDHLTAAGISWVYYEQDLAFLRMYNRYRLDDTNVIPLHDPEEGFFVRARAGTLPRVTFIDPNFVDVPPLRTANDDHPPANIAFGQDMIACIYDSLIQSPQWGKMLFVVTYDEHGGFYDHVPPPGTAASPADPPIAKLHPDGPAFLGGRVPAFVISPWIRARTVSHTVFDHTAITRTIALRFLADKLPNLGARVRQAQHLGILLTNRRPRLNAPSLGTDCPPRPFSPPKIPEEFDGLPPHKAERDDFHEGVRRFGKPRF